jgi:hypothetical protein
MEKAKLLKRVFSAEQNGRKNIVPDKKLLDYWSFASKARISKKRLLIFLGQALKDVVDPEIGSLCLLPRNARTNGSRDFLDKTNGILSEFQFSLGFSPNSKRTDECVSLNVFHCHKGFRFQDPYFRILHKKNPTFASLPSQLKSFLKNWRGNGVNLSFFFSSCHLFSGRA